MASDQTVAGDEIGKESGVIELRVRELSQLFNSMDPSPFLEKDLDVDAEEFIVSWARELPEDAPLSVLVHLDRATVQPDDARVLQEAIHSYFHHRAELTQRRLRDLLRRGRTSLFIGILCVTGSILLGDLVVYLLGAIRVGVVIQESLLIGGWVAMWRPLEIFLYDWWPIRNERRIFDRLSKSAVRVACSGKT